MESLKKDSEDGIEDNQKEIKKYLERFDQKTEFLKYFKNELKNLFFQLNLKEYFVGIIDFNIESELIKPEPPVS